MKSPPRRRPSRKRLLCFGDQLSNQLSLSCLTSLIVMQHLFPAPLGPDTPPTDPKDYSFEEIAGLIKASEEDMKIDLSSFVFLSYQISFLAFAGRTFLKRLSNRERMCRRMPPVSYSIPYWIRLAVAVWAYVERGGRLIR